jgi:hypothetical protein
MPSCRPVAGLRYTSVMPTVSLKAHYDGKTIRLDEPFDLPPNARLMVTVLPPLTGSDREDWSNLSVANLARVYGDDEPDYPVTSVRDR